jgi:integration host factor subunit beta
MIGTHGDAYGKKLTKAELIEALHESQGLTRNDIHECVDALFEELKRAMLAGKPVELRGFGTFEVRLRKGRTHARNPKTGETVSVADHGVAAFRPGRELRRQAWIVKSPSKVKQ